eukprot:TRINITY_DN23447_c0_g1_i1.p1 TRINITY_DN23447_c0_g1~~TRINITY_DN23447_c0_g1_i1.p1  ORF type:complete len:708 (+),score=122.81 TRINITY_DN23447_c0_g1_i1:123-2126(+)
MASAAAAEAADGGEAAAEAAPPSSPLPRVSAQALRGSDPKDCDEEAAAGEDAALEMRGLDSKPDEALAPRLDAATLEAEDAREVELAHADLLALPSLALSRTDVVLHLALATLGCYAGARLVLAAVPVLRDRGAGGSGLWHRISCTDEGDISHFLQTNLDQLHFSSSGLSTEKWALPGVGGAWLPLCASTSVACQEGFYARAGTPRVSCTPEGRYSWEGRCDAISCGTPPVLPHGTPRMEDVAQQDWTYGVNIGYDCDKPGFRGNLRALCNITGVWLVYGNCEQITCGPAIAIPSARPLSEAGLSGENVSAGTVIRYQCDAKFHGTPTATCTDDGVYITEGRCRRECGPPPAVMHASPSFDNAVVTNGWMEGMRSPYVCDFGFQGFVTALCGVDGHYTVHGQCVPTFCGPPLQLPHATPETKDIIRQNFTYGAKVQYACTKPRFRGRLEATCTESGKWDVRGRCIEITCSLPPPSLAHARAYFNNEDTPAHVSVGTIVKYQCDDSFSGSPSATCDDDGHYVTSGRCLRECGPPPMLSHASPNFDSAAVVAAGWLEGTRVSYECDVGFEGSMVALCGRDGSYNISGQCRVALSVELEQLSRRMQTLEATLGAESLVLLSLLAVAFWRVRRARSFARSLPLLANGPNQELTEASSFQCVNSDAADAPPA